MDGFFSEDEIIHHVLNSAEQQGVPDGFVDTSRLRTALVAIGDFLTGRDLLEAAGQATYVDDFAHMFESQFSYTEDDPSDLGTAAAWLLLLPYRHLEEESLVSFLDACDAFLRSPESPLAELLTTDAHNTLLGLLEVLQPLRLKNLCDVEVLNFRIFNFFVNSEGALDPIRGPHLASVIGVIMLIFQCGHGNPAMTADMSTFIQDDLSAMLRAIELIPYWERTDEAA